MNKLSLRGLLSSLLLPSLLLSATKTYVEDTPINTYQQSKQTKIRSNIRSNQSRLELRQSYRTKSGKLIQRYTQKYNNIPVLGADIVISKDPVTMREKRHGSSIENIGQDLPTTNPTLSTNDALEKAKEYFAKKVKVSLSKLKISQESSLLKIWLDTKNIAKLVYEVSFEYTDKEVAQPQYIIDAKSGKLLDYHDTLQHFNATGQGGNEKIGLREYGSGSYDYLKVTKINNNCIMDTNDLHIFEYNATEPFHFTCPENNYKESNGAYSPLNDALYYTQKNVEMYKEWFDINSIAGVKLKLIVHYLSNGKPYPNAHWNAQRKTFYFGDGNAKLHPFTTLNIVSHEIAHSFTTRTSRLRYARQSGGLNEAFSDMAAEAVEYYLLGTNDWLMGSAVFKDSEAGRSMKNPTRYPPSIDHQDNYLDKTNIHHSSGVYNKAFYLLANSEGWNTKKAFEVYLKANEEYWTQYVDWNHAANGVIEAACDLNYDIASIINSLEQVGVYPTISDCSQAIVNSSSLITSPENNTELIENTVTIEWSKGTNIKSRYLTVRNVTNNTEILSEEVSETLLKTVSNIPNDGSILLVLLTSTFEDDSDETQSYQYSTKIKSLEKQSSQITYPLNNTQLQSDTVTFTWNNPNDIKRWYLLVQNKDTNRTIHNGIIYQSLKQKISTLPTEGQNISVYFMPLDANYFGIMQHYNYTATQ